MLGQGSIPRRPSLLSAGAPPPRPARSRPQLQACAHLRADTDMMLCSVAAVAVSAVPDQGLRQSVRRGSGLLQQYSRVYRER